MGTEEARKALSSCFHGISSRSSPYPSSNLLLVTTAFWDSSSLVHLLWTSVSFLHATQGSTLLLVSETQSSGGKGQVTTTCNGNNFFFFLIESGLGEAWLTSCSKYNQSWSLILRLMSPQYSFIMRSIYTQEHGEGGCYRSVQQLVFVRGSFILAGKTSTQVTIM